MRKLVAGLLAFGVVTSSAWGALSVRSDLGAGGPAGVVVNDLFASTTTDILSASLVVQLSSGSVNQAAPNSSLILSQGGGDTYVTVNNDPSSDVAGSGNPDIGGDVNGDGVAQLGGQLIDITYFDTATDDISGGGGVLMGDASKDGLVTGADLISVQQNFGSVGTTPLIGDANNDGLVTGADLISVQQNFGSVAGPGDVVMGTISFTNNANGSGMWRVDSFEDSVIRTVSLANGVVTLGGAAPVPEPASLALLGLGTLAGCRRR